MTTAWGVGRIGRRELLALAFISACRREPPLPVLGRVPAFALKDQQGRPVGSAELRGKPWVAAFMFTRCPTICPRITRRMRELQIDARARGVPLRLVSFSVDPENDTPEVLRAYAERFGVDQASWSFLTGKLEVVQKTAIDGFKMALENSPGAEPESILHGSHLVLVDSKLDLRGYYRSESPEETARLLVDFGRV
jgi:protein SCO1/2